jgi:hypothetical protein
MKQLILNKILIKIKSLAAVGFVSVGIYNSLVVNNTSFMGKKNEITFAKRLDEVNGNLVKANRSVASVAPVQAKEVIATVNKMKKNMNNTEVAKTQAPAIKEDLNLNLTQVLFDKKQLGPNDFLGNVRTVDGMIEELSVEFPNGRKIEILSSEIAGNVFHYEDEDGNMASAMFYEVKPGQYMVTLTNDSQFAGTRMQFEVPAAELAYNVEHVENTVNWNTEDDSLEVLHADNHDFENETEVKAVDNVDYGFNFSV